MGRVGEEKEGLPGHFGKQEEKMTSYVTETEEEHAIQKALAEYLGKFDYLYCKNKDYGLIVMFHDAYRSRQGQVRIDINERNGEILAAVWSPKNLSKDDNRIMEMIFIDLHDPESFDKIRQQFDFRSIAKITSCKVIRMANEGAPNPCRLEVF